jgi:glc operon protein GlcG
LVEAKRIIEGAIAKAEELNIKVSAAVVDNGGRLIATNKMDGAIWASTYGCIGKAVGHQLLAGPAGRCRRAPTNLHPGSSIQLA